MPHYRLTITPIGDPAAELRTAMAVRHDLYAAAPITLPPDRPTAATFRDAQGRAYFEFATDRPSEVERVLAERHHAGRVALAASDELPGPACENCGNVAGAVLPTVCPNCAFRDISPCPHCGTEVPRQQYVRDVADIYRCPACDHRVRFSFNRPMFDREGNYREPLVVVRDALTATPS